MINGIRVPVHFLLQEAPRRLTNAIHLQNIHSNPATKTYKMLFTYKTFKPQTTYKMATKTYKMLFTYKTYIQTSNHLQNIQTSNHLQNGHVHTFKPQTTYKMLLTYKTFKPQTTYKMLLTYKTFKPQTTYKMATYIHSNLKPGHEDLQMLFTYKTYIHLQNIRELYLQTPLSLHLPSDFPSLHGQTVCYLLSCYFMVSQSCHTHATPFHTYDCCSLPHQFLALKPQRPFPHALFPFCSSSHLDFVFNAL